jgi:hypothetical protein
MRLAYDIAPKIGNTLSRQTFDADVRHYLRSADRGLLATRLRGFKSTGDFPDFLYFGGNSELRGYDYLEFAGQNTVFANAELRFPLIEAALTPIGVIGGIRGVFFAGIGGSWFNNQATQNACTGESSKFRFANSTLERARCRSASSWAPTARRCSSPIRSPACSRRSQLRDAERVGLPPAGRPRVVRARPRNVRARLPDPLRLVVADALQQGLGRSGVRLRLARLADRHRA